MFMDMDFLSSACGRARRSLAGERDRVKHIRRRDCKKSRQRRGLVGLGRTTAGAWNGVRPQRLRLSVELCAMYWHFLLFVWLAIFALLAGWAATFVDICRDLLT